MNFILVCKAYIKYLRCQPQVSLVLQLTEQVFHRIKDNFILSSTQLISGLDAVYTTQILQLLQARGMTRGTVALVLKSTGSEPDLIFVARHLVSPTTCLPTRMRFQERCLSHWCSMALTVPAE